ncbi:hypothetical protein [Nostoc sp. UHCC 0870]|uniref:hypothetical protein n=1 Tax=Nostoc sp. UHCC 0870 TaxID=2914041 RepID=UPI001EDEE780|nr:hypothetical protein [Nostoc sp. UHCC 0870]UKO99641.1 hypothetical protein L6494_08015 [Nostoc sp. UHCC 0870]
MSSIPINVGDAFLIDTPPNGQHLYIAIAQTSDTKYLFVNITTRKPNSETVCILLPGADVPNFIVRESVVAYQYAREMDATILASLITSGSPIPKGNCSPAVLSKIQQGGLISKRLKNKYKTLLKSYLGIV